MVLDGDDPAGRLGRCLQRLGVDRLDRVEVDHAGVDSFLREHVRRAQRFVDRHAGADERHLVLVGRAHHPAAADLELLVGVVDHRRVRRSVRMNTIPSVSAIAATSFAVWFASEGCSTVLE